MERSRLKDIKILFFAGVNEGSVPRQKDSGGLLSEMDRETLLSQNVELSPTSRQETCIQKYYMYVNLTRPSMRLKLSWSLADEGGNALRPSYLIRSVQELFPQVAVETEAEQELLDRLASPEGNLSDVTEALQAAREGTYDAQQKMLARWYAEQADWNQKLDRLMDAVFYSRKEEPIGKAVAADSVWNPSGGKCYQTGAVCSCSYALSSV